MSCCRVSLEKIQPSFTKILIIFCNCDAKKWLFVLFCKKEFGKLLETFFFMLNILTELKLDHFFWWDWIEIVLNLLFGTQWQFLKQFKFFLRQSNFTWIEWNSFKLRSNVYILNHNSFLLKKCQKALVIHGKRSYIQIYPFLWFFVVEKWIKKTIRINKYKRFCL